MNSSMKLALALCVVGALCADARTLNSMPGSSITIIDQAVVKSALLEGMKCAVDSQVTLHFHLVHDFIVV